MESKQVAQPESDRALMHDGNARSSWGAKDSPLRTSSALTMPITHTRRPVINVAFVGNPEMIQDVFGLGRRDAWEACSNVQPGVVTPEDLELHPSKLADVEAVVSTWGMPVLDDAQLDAMPNLKAVFYAAGSVNGFAQPLLDRGIIVSSAWQANAVPVAEFTLSQILLACKGYFRNVREYRATPSIGYETSRGPGVFGETIALLGAGAIGRRLIELLRPFHLHILVFDPFMSEEQAKALGVEKVSLIEAFERGYVVSNHLANKPQTVSLIDGQLLCRMRSGATFINTGRGKTVYHDEMIDVLRKRPDLTALLDVTDPEPLPDNSPLFDLANVMVSSHIAGSIRDEVRRMADYMLEEFNRYIAGEPMKYLVTDIDRSA